MVRPYQRCRAPAFAVVAMACGAPLRINHSTFCRCAAAWGQAHSIRVDADVPGGDVSRVDRLAKVGPITESGAYYQSKDEKTSLCIDMLDLPARIDAPARDCVVVLVREGEDRGSLL